MMPKIHLTGYIDVPADRLAQIEPALAVHKELTRAEPGCLSFNVDPCPSVAGRFLVDEVFQDRTAFDAHQARAKASDWGRISTGIPRNFDIEEID